MATQGNDTGGAVYLRVGLDASGVSEGVTDIKQELNTLPAAAAQVAQNTGRNLASLGIPKEAIADVQRFKEAFGDIGRVTSKELGESARATNAFVSAIKRAAIDTEGVTQNTVTSFLKKQQSDARLQNDVVDRAIAATQRLASENAITAAAINKQAAAQQVANKATQDAAAQFNNFKTSAQAARLELLSFGKTASEKYQIRAELLGIDKTQAVQKIVADLKSAEAAALAAGKGVGQSITPALQGAALQGKALNAALRQVPAQFTDIVVSLQGGQAPLTVLLQQGGQLKDVFGGVGAATEALGKYVLGLVNPFTVAAAAVGTFGIAFYQGRKESEEFNKALILTGNQSGLTVTKLNDIAASMDNVAGVTKGSAAQALLAFTNSTGVASGSFERFAAIAIRMQNATGLAVAETVTQFAALAKDPVSASLKLNETTNFLTVSIYKQIKALEDQGKTSEAAALAQNAYASAMEQRLPRLEENLGTLEKAWKTIANAAKEGWDAMLNVGRTANPLDAARGALASAEQALERAREAANAGGLRDSSQANADARVQRLERTLKLRQDEVMLLGKGAGYEALSAQYQQQNAARTAAQAVFDKDHDKYLSKAVQMAREIAQARNRAATANEGADPVTIAENQRKLAEQEAGIRKKFAEQKGPAAKPDAFLTDVAKAYTKALEDLDKVQLTTSASADKLSKTQEVLRGIQASPEWAAFSFRKKEEVIMAASLAQAEEDRVATLEAAKKAQDAYNNSAKESANAVAKKLQDLGDETRAYAIATEKNISLAEAIDLVAISRLEEELVRAKIANNVTGQKELEREIELRKELAKELRKKSDNTAQVEAGKAAAAATLAEWKRGWEETDRIARDVFTTWATDGSNAAKKIGDTLKKALLSAVYEATLKPLVMQVYTSVAGAKPGTTGGGTAGLPGSGGGSGFTGTGFRGFATSGVESLGEAFINSGNETLNGVGSTLLNNSSEIAGFANIAGEALGYLNAIDLWTQGQRGAAAGAAIGTYFGGPVGAAIGQAIGSTLDYKVDAKGGGITATIGGASGLPSGSVGMFNEFQQTGGLGGGGTTINRDWSVADAGVANYIAGNVQRITATNKAYADALGLTSAGIETFTKSIEINTTGMDAAAQQAAINSELVTFATEQAAATYGDAVAQYARDGETTAQTLQRLGTDLSGTNAMFADLGYTLFDVSVAGANAASTLVAAFGNLQAAQAQMGSFYQNFYSQDEQQANTYRTVQSDLANAGFNFTVEDLRAATREDIRAAVDGLAGNTGTEQGAAQYAAAVRAANTLATVKPVVAPAPPPPAPASFGSSSSGGGYTAPSVADAANDVVSAWQDAADAIIATMTDIRLSSLETGAASFTKLKAQFAVEIAQASAGDLAAMQDLPELAKALENANKENAKSAVDQALFTSYILESLGRVSGAGAPGPALTAPNYTGVAAVSAVAPVPIPVYIPPSTGGGAPVGSDAVFARMEQRLAAIEASNEKLRKLLFDVTEGGRAMQTEAYS